jgi:hypothetical protein
MKAESDHADSWNSNAVKFSANRDEKEMRVAEHNERRIEPANAIGKGMTHMHEKQDKLVN